MNACSSETLNSAGAPVFLHNGCISSSTMGLPGRSGPWSQGRSSPHIMIARSANERSLPATRFGSSLEMGRRQTDEQSLSGCFLPVRGGSQAS